MKKILIALALFTTTFAMAKTPVRSTIDERVELFSIIFRLAGNPEYNMKFAKHYIADINAHFALYNNDPVISFAKELATEKNMGFSKVMFLAVHLKKSKNGFTMIPEQKSNLIGKWDPADAEKFVGLVNSFYRRSGFNLFFRAHKKRYTQATRDFDQSIDGFDQQWYLDYYGDHQVDYRVAIGLGDGGANYGPSVTPIGSKRRVYAIMGSWTFTADGTPLFARKTYLSDLIHEFNHSFIDHILEQSPRIDSMLSASGEILLAARRKEMKLEGYEDWHSLINESLVRASVVRYIIDHKQSQKEINNEIAKQREKGFTWMEDLVQLLGEYETSRASYPTFEHFYPRLTTFFEKTATNISR